MSRWIASLAMLLIALFVPVDPAAADTGDTQHLDLPDPSAGAVRAAALVTQAPFTFQAILDRVIYIHQAGRTEAVADGDLIRWRGALYQVRGIGDRVLFVPLEGQRAVAFPVGNGATPAIPSDRVTGAAK